MKQTPMFEEIIYNDKSSTVTAKLIYSKDTCYMSTVCTAKPFNVWSIATDNTEPEHWQDTLKHILHMNRLPFKAKAFNY